MTAALVLSGGPGHPASASAPALRGLLGDGADVTEDIDGGLARLDPGRHDLLVVNALAFGMRDARYDDEARAAHAFSLDGAGRAAVEAWIGAGRPLLALHTAVLCFDEWPRWGEIVGGRWDWQRSWHPPVGPLEVDVALPGVAGFDVVDERYSDLALADDIDVVATCDGVPVAWTRHEGRARVACSTLGHDAASLDAPGHRLLLHALVAWLLEERCPT